MTETIWKHPLKVIDSQDVVLHLPAQILTVQVQHGTPCLWVAEDPEKAIVTRRILTMGTGHPDPGVRWNYIGTYQLEAGAFVGHVAEVVEEKTDR